jgi:type III secretion protein N (ATPase)
MERTGMSNEGSITALYTVLVEGDDMTEPVADETRSILDGHIILSRSLAAANHFPAIDILQSTSRVMNAVVDQKHLECASKIRTLLAKYDEIKLLVRVGEYKQGSDRVADEALNKIDKINSFLKQPINSITDYENTKKELYRLAGI